MSFLKKEYKYLLFILPAFLIYTIITVVPVFYTFFYSLTDFNGLSKDIHFVGLENYVKVFTTSNIRISFLNSIIFGIATPVLVTAIAIPLAIVLNGKMKTKNIQRAVFFFPSVISALFLGYIWNFILSPSSMGLVNSVLTSLGKDKL
ncbi:MAG: sugar ABC transporter permease, partial [Lachnospiraceae bacterium]|nr:sugar ABC transporter permease [Lachnospiraceae bacterium]